MAGAGETPTHPWWATFIAWGGGASRRGVVWVSRAVSGDFLSDPSRVWCRPESPSASSPLHVAVRPPVFSLFLESGLSEAFFRPRQKTNTPRLHGAFSHFSSHAQLFALMKSVFRRWDGEGETSSSTPSDLRALLDHLVGSTLSRVAFVVG